MVEVINFRSFVSGEYKKKENVLTAKELQVYEMTKDLITLFFIALAIKFMWPVAPALTAFILK